MKELIDKVFLKRRATNQFEEADLYRGIDANNLAHIEGRWRPLFEIRKRQARASKETMAQINAEDAHWEWGKKTLAAIRDPLTFDIFVLESDGSTQGLMLVRKGGTACFSRHPEHERALMVYVEFLATAPWNRPRLVDDPIFKGVGATLLMAAIVLSLEEGLGGRVALHSLPEAEQFYRDIVGMTDLGVEQDGAHKGLRYFELPASRASTFLSEQH